MSRFTLIFLVALLLLMTVFAKQFAGPTRTLRPTPASAKVEHPSQVAIAAKPQLIVHHLPRTEN